MKTRATLLTAIGVWTLALTTTLGGQAQGLFGALPTRAEAPDDNPTTAARVELGRLLFWDPILSGQRDIACATCHHPDFGYAEPLDLSIGTGGVGLGSARAFAPDVPVRFVKRNSQTVLNTAFNGLGTTGAHTPAAAPMFWDLRVQSLEAQALEPIKALEEMRGSAYAEDEALAAVVARLAAIPEYRERFTDAFGGRDAVNATNLGRALAAFERTLTTVNTPFDRYMRGDTTAMTDAQIRGMNRFESTGCGNCHSGPMFSDFKTHVLAVPDNARLSTSDTGVDGTYAFRTPSLRNLKYTAPYMHSGVFRSLNQVVNFYQRISGRGGRGGRGTTINANVSPGQIDPLARQLRMRGRGQNDIVAFLEALSDGGFDRTIPERVPSGLTVGGH